MHGQVYILGTYVLSEVTPSYVCFIPLQELLKIQCVMGSQLYYSSLN